jgi:hypothetical protein
LNVTSSHSLSDKEIEALRGLLQPPSGRVSLFLNIGKDDPRNSRFQELAGKLLDAGLAQGDPTPDDDFTTAGPFLAFSREGRPPRHFYQALPVKNEWAPFYQLIKTLTAGDSALSPESLAAVQNLAEPITLRVLITPECPFCARVVGLVNQLAAAGPKLKTWITDAQLFPEWLLKVAVKAVPVIILDQEVVKTGAISERELVGLLEKRRSSDYPEQLYRNDLLEKRMAQATERLKSRLQDLPLIVRLIKAEEFGVKLGAMALIEQISEEMPESRPLVFEALLPLLQEQSEQVLGDGAYLLGALEDPRKNTVLRPLLNHANPEIREIAREALGSVLADREAET